jgi:hypothetical protein
VADIEVTALAASYRRVSEAEGAHLDIAELEDDAFETASSAEGWIRGDALAAGDDEAYGTLRRAAVAFTGEVDAKTIGLAMAWAAGPVIAAPVAVYAAERRVPELTLADLAFRPHGAHPEGLIARPVPFACLPGDAWATIDPLARPVADEEALRIRFVAVVEALMEPIVERIHRQSTIARSAIWGLAAGQIAYELAEAGLTEIPIDDAITSADRTIAAAPRLGRRRPDLFVFDAPGGPWFGMKGSACCRAYKWSAREGEYCLSCPLRDDESRLDGLRAWRASLVPAG